MVLLGLDVHAQGKDGKVVIGTIDSLYSATLKENRNYWVYLPPSYSERNRNARFPVLYLLDGDAHFHSVTGLIQQLAGGVNGNTLFPEMIVVAIPNTDRTRDLTPTPAVKGPDGKEMAFLKTSGGGEHFAGFLQKELIPHIDSMFLTAPYRMLVGHSFGGLTVMNMLVHHTELFNSYIAIDPSMWWDNGRLLKETGEALARKKFTGKSLYLGVANTLPAGMRIADVDKDSSNETAHIRSIRKLASMLQNNHAGLRFASQYFNEDDHGSVPLITEYYGLRFLFDGYRMTESKATAGIDSLTEHYKKISVMMGYTILPPEGLVNQIGYLYLEAAEFDKALAHFALNVKNYPESPNVYDSMGDAYLARGDKAKAREQFLKALEKDPANPGTKEKLDGIKN